MTIEPRMASVILAAGKSSRMGFPKPLLRFRESTFLRHIVDLHRALGLPVHVVLGEHRERIQSELDLRDAIVWVNPDPERGQLSSLQVAIQQLGEWPAVLVHPVDHPAVLPATLALLVEKAATFPGRLVFPVYGGRRGHPVVFPQTLFLDILTAPLDEGARAVVRRHPDLLIPIPVEDPGVLQNIDTPEAYRALSQP